MTQTETLDTKLRKRGEVKCQAAVTAEVTRVRHAIDRMDKFSNYGTNTNSGLLKEGDTRPMKVWAVLDHLSSVLVAAYKAGWGQHEVDEFVADLERVKADVESLGTRIEEQ